MTLHDMHAELGDRSSAPIQEVDVSFAWEGVDDAAWTVVDALIVEAVSSLYEIRLEMRVSDFDGDVRGLLGRRATVRLRRDSVERRFHGIVRRAVRPGEILHGREVVHLVLAPAMWRLTKRKNTRVLHHADVPTIVKRVLADAGVYQGDGDLVVHIVETGQTYKPREYCVQYDETDLEFVMRLLADEGLTFYFRHDGTASETLAIVDGALAASALAYPDVAVRSDDRRVQRTTARAYADAESLTSFSLAADIESSHYGVRDFDFTNVMNVAAVTYDRPRKPDTGALAVYDYPGRFVFVDLDDPKTPIQSTLSRILPDAAAPPRYDQHSGARVADLAHEALRGNDLRFVGKGNVSGMTPGFRFELADEHDSAYDGDYVVVGVSHEVHVHAETGGSENVLRNRYENTFECIPRDVVFRPPQLVRKPRIHGVQTATVVGHLGEEILTDWYGRVKVQFHWDRVHNAARNDIHRYGPAAVTGDPNDDPTALCWVRVAQMWAGTGWGTMFVPRAGMEVVVSFLDGDPDRPLIVGCVYNNSNVPPYMLPQSASISTIKTRSTPHTDGAHVGFNELRFEDAQGREEIYTHAERDYVEHVERDHRTTVDRDQHLVVLANQNTAVSLEQTLTVGGSQTSTVAGRQSNIVGGTQNEVVSENAQQIVVGNRERTVVRDERVVVHGDQHLDVRGKTNRIFGGPVETVVKAPPPPPPPKDRDANEGDADDAPEDDDAKRSGGIRYVEKRTVHGHRFVQVHGLQQNFAERRRARIDHDDVVVAGGLHLVNALEANLLVGDVKDASSLTSGYYFNRDKVRVGTKNAAANLRLFRGDERLSFEDKVTLSSKSKDLVIEIAGTSCKIRLSSDGTAISLEAAEKIELKAGAASLTLGPSVVLDAGGGSITLK